MKILVDSAERISGTPEDYVFRTWAELGNATRLELIAAYVPRTMNIVNTPAITFTFSTGAGTWSAAGIPGGYTPTKVAADIQTYIQGSVTGQGTATFVFDYQTGKFVLTPAATTTVTSIVPNNEWTARVVGLTPDLAAHTGFPNVVQFNNPEYLLLDVNVGNGFSNDLQTDGSAHSFFVPLNVEFGGIKEMTEASHFAQIDKVPNLHLYEFRVKWRPPQRYQNDTFDFEGADHQLLFRAS